MALGDYDESNRITQTRQGLKIQWHYKGIHLYDEFETLRVDTEHFINY